MEKRKDFLATGSKFCSSRLFELIYKPNPDSNNSKVDSNADNVSSKQKRKHKNKSDKDKPGKKGQK